LINVSRNLIKNMEPDGYKKGLTGYLTRTPQRGAVGKTLVSTLSQKDRRSRAVVCRVRPYNAQVILHGFVFIRRSSAVKRAII